MTSAETLDRAGPAELARLLGAVALSDRDALGEVYRRTSAKLFGIALRLLGDRGEAQDLLQEVYLQIWRSAGSFDAGKASPITWLAVMTRNKAIDRLRRQRTAAVTGMDDAMASLVDERPTALEVACEAQDASRLGVCLETLEERPRGLIRAAFLDGRTYSQLAEGEGVPLGTMKSWIRRGLQRLRGCLET